MNSHQAKQIDLPDLLSRLGYQPVKTLKGGRELWYPSPFRKEKDASFHTSFLDGKWIWKDFGDAGGNVIDFVMRYKDIPFKEALAFLRGIYQGNLFEDSKGVGSTFQKSSNHLSFQQHDLRTDEQLEDERELEFLEAYKIKNPVIFSYLENERKIPVNLVKLYLQEVKYRYKPKNKIFFAFGMKNESGGYEIRNASDQSVFKSALIERNITYFSGEEGGNTSVSVFEGMTDYLSLLALLKIKNLDGSTIVMHSTSTYDRAANFIKKMNFTTIHSFLDNNSTGRKYTQKFKEDFPNMVQDHSHLIFPHEDLNDALKKGFTANFSPGLRF